MKNVKKVVSVLLCLIFIFSCTQMIASAEDAVPYYQNISSNSCSLRISGINSTSSANLIAARSMSLSIKMELQKVKSGTYTTIETWSSSKTGVSISMEETRLINMLATYRLKVTFTAGSETIVQYAYP